MQVLAAHSDVTQCDAAAVVLGVHDQAELSGPSARVDAVSGGLLRRLRERGEITSRMLELNTLFSVPGVHASQVLVVGLGEKGAFNTQAAFRASACAARHLASKSRERVAFYLADGWSPSQEEAGLAGALVGCHGQDLYRNEKKRFPFGQIEWFGEQAAARSSGQILGEAVNLARRLVNEPPQEIYPQSFAEQAERVAAESGLGIEVWDQARLEEEGAGSLLAVAKGSSRPPRLVILKYQGGAVNAAPLALVGKGVTFDSGGLSLKPNDSMKTMKCDMAGAATVLGAMQAIARLKLPLNVVGLMGLVENMPGGAAMKLGDVLHARNGRTIEVLNTDAEGRLVLADVLDVALELGASHIIDLATLTGACVVALGMDVAGIMTNDQAWCDRVREASVACGEPAWQLPMFAEYREQIQSEVADIRNVGEGRWGGAISAAKFLEEFVGETPWVHFDIAGPAFLEGPKPWLDAGATGAFVRTLVQVARTMA